MRPCFQRCIGKTAWTVPQDSPAEQDTRGEIAVQCVHSRQNRGGSTQRQSAEWQPYAAHFEFKQMLIWKHFGKLCPIHSVHLAVDTYWYYMVSIYRFFIKKSTETGRTNFFPYFPSKFPWHSHESHLHRLIPHFVQIRIQKFRCKAVGTDFGQ